MGGDSEGVGLEDLDGALFDSDRPPYRAPGTELESAVAAVWSGLLEVDDVGLDDDFFALGGFSLQLPDLAERLGAAVDGVVALTDLYPRTTVAAQAELLSTASAGPPELPDSADPDGPAPLSPGQRRIWFLDRMSPRSPEWVVPLFLDVPASVPPETVRQTVDVLVERHPALRTRIREVGGEPQQVVDPPAPSTLHVVDLEPGDEPARDRVVAGELAAGFDLERGPVLRAMLVRGLGARHQVLLTVHHIACDGWSASLVESQFRTVCADLAVGRPPSGSAPRVRYTDLARHQHAADRRAREDDLGFWSAELADLPGPTLPVDRPRPARRDVAGALKTFVLPATTGRTLSSLARRHRTAPFAVVATALATVLARTGGSWDVPIGVPVAGRSRPGTADVVGFFLNTVVVRCRIAPSLTFAAALETVRDTTARALAHAEVPFDEVVEQVAPDRDGSHTPLYRAALNITDTEVAGGLRHPQAAELLARNRRVAKTDLTLYLDPAADGAWTGALEYATALFDAGTAEQLTEALTVVLTAVATDPAVALGELPVLEDTRRGVLAATTGERVDGWTSPSVPEMIEAQCREHPNATAVVAGEDRLTYRELDERACRIGHLLRERGAGPETVVAVVLPRDETLVPTLLGVWKAGAAYLPIDPDVPPERLRELLADSGARVVVARASTRPGADVGTADQLVLDDVADELAASPVTAPALAHDPRGLAYVIYTSGSTGTPKGVLIEHAGLANHLRWAARDLVRAPGGGALFSSPAFDLPATNIYAPLITGEPVYVLPESAVFDLAAALRAVAPLSFLKLTPAHLDLLGEPTAVARTVVVAGEAFSTHAAASWSAALGPDRLVNEYGPTETSIGSTIHAIPGAEPDGVVPIGTALPNTTAHVVDDQGRLVPPCAIGELHVGGDGVGRGYLDRPGLTADRFVPDPFGPPGARLYRTGDLVRRRTDGALVFCGRSDRQVKVRGHRVELGEIETALRGCAGIREAVVVDRRAVAGTVLDAYVVTDGGGTAHTARTELAQRVPGHLVPNTVTEIDAVPLTANGKIARDRLPDPSAGDPDASRTDRSAPATAVETQIAGLWRELLGRPRVGLDENFFALGGHSIIAVRLASRLQEHFDLEIGVQAVFAAPTVRGLAATVEVAARARIDELSDEELLALVGGSES